MWDLWWTKWHWERFFSPSTSVFPRQFYSTGAPLHGKTKKLIIFITGLHNKPEGCGASVASAAGPFTTTTKNHVIKFSTSLTYARCYLLFGKYLFHAFLFLSGLKQDNALSPDTNFPPHCSVRETKNHMFAYAALC
jgi:hypothetical protein